jgi:hypothetical protein
MPRIAARSRTRKHTGNRCVRVPEQTDADWEEESD